MGTSILEAAARAIFDEEERDLPQRTRTTWANATLLVRGHYLQRALICARTFGDLTGASVLEQCGMSDPAENFIVRGEDAR